MMKTIFCYLVPNLSYKGGGVTVSAQRGPTILTLSVAMLLIILPLFYIATVAIQL